MAVVDLTRAPQTDPLEIYRYRDGLYAVDLLTAAVAHLDFFSWLAAHPADAAGICRHFGFAERPVDVMLTLFAALGLIERGAGGVCRVTPLAGEHLTGGSPWNLAPYYASLKDRPVCRDFLTVLKTGRPANWGGQPNQPDWHQGMESEAFARQFTAAMDCRGIYLARALATKLDLRGRRRLLDLGGGSGIYACSLVAHHPALRAVVFEQKPVDAMAARLVTQRGFADRVGVAAGDLFRDPWPADCDVHLFSNVLHDWDVPEVRQLLAASHRALAPGGLLVIHDAFINAAKTGPRPVAEYSTLLMHSTRGKCYSVGEYAAMLAEAGFDPGPYFDTAADRGAMTARKHG